MAVIAASLDRHPTSGYRNALLVTWSPMANGDTGAPVIEAEYADRTVQIGGTFGLNGSVTLEGSNDGATYFPLTDPQGNAITKTAAALEVIQEGPKYMRPSVTAGDGTTAITVTVFARRSR